jgi:calcineurin-like phosphoesterase family protein
MIWFTSDPHYFHRSVIGYCKRPFADVNEMNEALIKNWNDRVRKQDTVYVLGDFSFGNKANTKAVLARLKGRKILIAGNHDSAPHKMLELGFDEVHENKIVQIGNIKVFVSHFPFYPTLWDKFKAWLKGYKLDTRYLHKRIVDDGETWLLHGHVHTAWKQRGRMLNVGVDVWGYKPVSHEKILQVIKEKE